MDAYLIFAGMIAALLVLFTMGVPIYASFLVCNLAGVVLLLGGGAGFGLFVNSMVSTATSPTLMTLPLFILMGELLYRANAVEALLDSVDKLVGNLRSRHYILSLAVSTIMATLNGSAMASSAMLSRTVYPVMRERGYDQNMTLGVIMGGACLAPIIPPSLLAIIVGTLAQVSIGDLFVAGVAPGLLISAMMICYVLVRTRMNPALAPVSVGFVRPTRKQVVGALLQLLPFTLIIGLVMGSIVGGIATPSESAAAGVIGALVLAGAARKLSVRMLVEAVTSTTVITAAIMAIMVSSQLFSQLLAFSGTSAILKELVGSVDAPPWVLLAIMMIIPFIIAMFIDEIAVMMILIPIYLPLLSTLGFHPIWFWTLFLVNITLGAIAPPVGYVLFVMQGILRDVSLGLLFRASIPYVFIYLLAIVVLAAFPSIVLFPFR